MNWPAFAVYDTHILHARMDRVNYRFDYQTAYVLVDALAPEQAMQGMSGLSYNRWNLWSLMHRALGSRTEQSWQAWLQEVLAAYQIPWPQGVQARLLAMPAVLGYGFNPLAIWYLQDAQGAPLAMIAQVSNTFGQHHSYVMDARGIDPAKPFKAQANKVFHVSPFVEMDCVYHFTFQWPGASVLVAIDEYRDDRLFLKAVQEGREQGISRSVWWKTFAKIPFQSLKVMGLIHWWALKIWIKGGTFHTLPHPHKTQHTHSIMERKDA
jgi:DUF1365 family protein